MTLTIPAHRLSAGGNLTVDSASCRLASVPAPPTSPLPLLLNALDDHDFGLGLYNLTDDVACNVVVFLVPGVYVLDTVEHNA